MACPNLIFESIGGLSNCAEAANVSEDKIL